MRTFNSQAAPRPGRPMRRFMQASALPVIDEKTRTLELSFSSETPCDQGFGDEILSHEPGAADLSRLNGGAPLLFNHDASDVLGVVESASIGADRKGRALVRLGRDERGSWALQQIADGILKNVSVTYLVEQYEQQPDGDTYIARAWTALEISIVTVPADPTVGVGRAFNQKDFNNMDIQDLANDGPQQQSRRSRQAATQAVELERDRVLSIQAACRRQNVPAMERGFIESGATIEEVRSQIFQSMQRSHVQKPVASYGTPTANPASGDVGLSDDEVQSFSLVRAVNAMLTNDWRNAGLERAASRTMEARYGRPTQGIFVPPEVMQRGWVGQRTPYVVGGGSGSTAGQSLVETSLMVDQFIDVLRNSAMVTQAGATILSGLQGNIDIPSQIAQSSSYWVSESGAPTESEGAFFKLSLRPKTIAGLSKMSRLMLLQGTPAIEMMARNDLMKVLGLGVDLAALSGSGASNQPSGIVNTVGMSPLILGTNGANVSLDTLTALETILNQGNAPMEGRAYMLNPKTVATLKNLKSSTGQYLWTDLPPGQRSGTPRTFGGYPVFVTNQVRGNLTKGSSTGICSELFFGSWPDLVIAQWGTLEVLVNPYDSTGFTTGDVLVRAFQTVDIGVRRSASFTVCSDALTP